MKYVGSRLLARARWSAALGAFAVALSVGVATGSAEAAIGTLSARLDIPPVNQFTHDVKVTGHVPMTTAEARALLDSGHRVVFRLWGSDLFDDDLIGGPYAMSVSASPRGLDFAGTVRLSYYYLDEDYGCVVGDEVYAGVRLLNSGGSTVRKGESNTVYGDWGCTRYA